MTTDRDDLPEAVAYTVTRWDCPVCGEVTEVNDFDELEPVETCEECGEEVRVR